MKRANPQEKLQKKRTALLERTRRILGDEASQLLRLERRQSVRLNPLKADLATTLQELRGLGWHGTAFSWCPSTFSVASPLEPLRDSQAAADGRIYIQNAASWLPVLALEPQPGESILDVCAAPGGKTAHIAALAGNQAHITANDNSRSRLARLQANCARLGVANIQYTLIDAQAIARRLEGSQFNKILLDAPCSGEGLLHLDDDKSMATWSVAHIKRLQQLQKKLLTQAWRLLAPGGRLVYSTCTMAPEENEAVVDYALRACPDAVLRPFVIEVPNRIPALASWNDVQFNPQISHCMRLAPSPTIEAFFVAVLERQAAEN